MVHYQEDRFSHGCGRFIVDRALRGICAATAQTFYIQIEWGQDG
jgi:hypothetical protein